MPEPKIDLSIQCFSSAMRAIVNHDRQPIPYSNFRQVDTYVHKSTLLGFLEQCPTKLLESSPIYLNIANLFENGKLSDHESDHIGDLLYITHYPQDKETKVQQADVSNYWGPDYEACLYRILEKHKELFCPELGMFNDEIKMPIPFKDKIDIDSLKQTLYNLSKKDQEAINKILDPLVQQRQVEKVLLGQPSVTALLAFVVWKNGKPKVIVDLRKMNTKLYPDAYPLPKQDQILGALRGSVIFSSMDILKGFFQQRIQKEDRWKTAFIMTQRP